MKRKEILMECYKLKKELINLKKQQITKDRDKEIEENFTTLVVGKPKMKALRKQRIS